MMDSRETRYKLKLSLDDSDKFLQLACELDRHAADSRAENDEESAKALELSAAQARAVVSLHENLCQAVRGTHCFVGGYDDYDPEPEPAPAHNDEQLRKAKPASELVQ